MTAREVAEDFIRKMNPSGWDGSRRKKPPKDFDTRVATYSIDDRPQYNIEIAYEQDDEWLIHVVIRDKASGDYLLGIWNCVLDSTDDLEKAIGFVLEDVEGRI